ncbi:MAG: carbohydrate porin [Elusimicrobia bacterium]|nr:carbohydrate porin [Elusimicrobiota bacterium]
MKKIILLLTMALVFCVTATAFAAATHSELAELRQHVHSLKGHIHEAPVLDEEAPELGIEFTFITTVQGNQNVGRNVATSVLDVDVLKEFSHGSIFLKLRTGLGAGLNNFLNAFNEVNTAADPNDFFNVEELWYEHKFLNDKLVFTFGKLDPTEYIDENEVANDEFADFLNEAFINNAAIAFPDNNLGVRASFELSEMLGLTYMGLIANEDEGDLSFRNQLFHAVELNFTPFANGNYRFMVWGSTTDKENLATGANTRKGHGFALSFDQQIREGITLFARYGWATADYFDVQSAVSGGISFGGGLWGRDDDKLAIAIGRTFFSGYFDGAGAMYAHQPETNAELFYSLNLGNGFIITPSLQYLSTPFSANGTNDHIFIYGLRAAITF